MRDLKQAFFMISALASELSGSLSGGTVKLDTADTVPRRRQKSSKWGGGEGQAEKYRLTRTIYAGRSSSIRKIQTLNRLKSMERAR